MADDLVPIGYPDIPTPGSPDAKAQGCRCPVLDNGNGRGYLGDGTRFGWVMSSDCQLHHRISKHAQVFDLGHLEAGSEIELTMEEDDAE